MSYQPTFFDQLSPERILRQDKANGVDPYVFNDDIVIAVDVALATGRPLLVSGLPGSGKSRLADAVAAVDAREDLLLRSKLLRELLLQQGNEDLVQRLAQHGGLVRRPAGERRYHVPRGQGPGKLSDHREQPDCCRHGYPRAGRPNVLP